MIENQHHDLTDEQGHILVPAEKRQPCEVYSRVVGYLRPQSAWNKGKKAEWRDRRVFTVKED